MVAAVQLPEIKRTKSPNLSVLVKGKAGVPMEEALVLAANARAVIASNQTLSRALGDVSSRQRIEDALGCWSGTMVGFVKSGRNFGHETDRIENGYFIVYTDSKTGIRYLFPVPVEHLDRKDCILAVNHPDFELVKDGNDRIVSAARVDLIERFPPEEGAYRGDPVYDIPTGTKVSDDDKTAKILWRNAMSNHVGLIPSCSVNTGSYYRRLINFHNPSSLFGVVIEAGI